MDYNGNLKCVDCDDSYDLHKCKSCLKPLCEICIKYGSPSCYSCLNTKIIAIKKTTATDTVHVY